MSSPRDDGLHWMEPSLTTRPAQPYVGVTRAVTMDHFAPVADRIPELIRHLAERGVAPAGAPFLRYHRIDMEHELIVEAGVPVADPQPGDGEIAAGELPAGRFVTLLHVGHPDELIGVTDGLLDWAAAQGLVLDSRPSPEGEVWGCRLEYFLSDPRDTPIDAWRTELAFRLAD